MMLDSRVELGLSGVLSVEGKSGIKLPNNLYLQYPQLRYVTNEEGHAEYVYDTKRGKQVIPTRVYGGKLVENICQALARCVIGSQLIAVSERYKPVLTVHDAIACIARKEEAEEAKAYVEECMRCAPDWATGLPLNCEAGIGRSYGEC
jgi:DNA polymerase